jgi:hypothetical protein
VETHASNDSAELRKLSDPELITRWAELRQRIAFSVGKSVPDELLGAYSAISAEYRRRITGD